MGKERVSSRLLPLAMVMLLAAWCCSAMEMDDEDSSASASRRDGRPGWRWPEEPNYGDVNRRTIGLRRPQVIEPPVPLGGKNTAKPIPAGFSVFPPPNTPRQVVQQTVTHPPRLLKPTAPALKQTVPPTTTTAPTTTAPPPTREEVAAPVVDADTPDEIKTTNKSSVPLLKDAGKPGNPYVLLNKEFPPENFIRTQAEEEANFNALQGKDLGGLKAEEVWLADSDLFVVRGFNYKVPYNPSRPEDGPINSYAAPAPRAPPPPEPGTAFYPTNQTVFNFGGQADFNSTDPTKLNGPSFPYPFLPPPPPHWHEEKEFNQNQNDLFDPFNSFGGNLQNNFQPNAPGSPPVSGLNGFPGGAVPPGGGQQGPPATSAPPPSNFTIPDDDEEVPFTPLFAERPVEYYFPEHNTTADPPGPFGPGVFVPPPVEYFAPRDPNEVIDVKIPEKLFRHPFNLPNYYQKQNQQQGRPAGRPGVFSQQQLPGQFLQTQIPTWPQSSPSIGVPTAKDPLPSIQTAIKPQKESHQSLGVHVIQPIVNPQQQQQPIKPVQVQPLKPATQIETDFKEVVGHQLPIQQFTPEQHQHQHSRPLYLHNPYGYYPEQVIQPGVSLEGDININYQQPTPAIDPDSELIDPLLFLTPNHQWDPYTIRSSHRKRPEQLTQPQNNYHFQLQHPTSDSSHSSDQPANFVSVYRLGGGSYSYNLGS